MKTELFGIPVNQSSLFPIHLATGQILISALVQHGHHISSPKAIIFWLTQNNEIIDFSKAPQPSN